MTLSESEYILVTIMSVLSGSIIDNFADKVTINGLFVLLDGCRIQNSFDDTSEYLQAQRHQVCASH